jgi:alpha-D-ribose 1-methylphosphonate 5-triphosphate synthase subunit PhnL
MTPLLQVQHYSKQFYIHHLERLIDVFSDITFTLQVGQFVSISGANGAGKSTLLRCLYRSYRPTQGVALYHSAFGAIDLATAADADMAFLRRQEIGFVSQFLRPRPRVSTLELVAEPLLNTGMSWQDAVQQAESMLDTFGLKRELWQAYPTTFSGGEQQKVNLARALIRPYRLLLLDEPTASLDKATRVSLASRLSELKAQGVAMIGVFHYPDEVRHIVDQEIPLTALSTDLQLDAEGQLYVAE